MKKVVVALRCAFCATDFSLRYRRGIGQNCAVLKDLEFKKNVLLNYLALACSRRQ